MPRNVNPPTRTYRSVVRDEQAQSTRRRIVEAAGRLFVDRGYAGTTIAAVAAEAGVSPETIYATLGGKMGLLEAVVERSILGPEDPLPLEQHTGFVRSTQLEEAPQRLRAFLAFLAEVLARTSPLHVVIRAAADQEPLAVDLRERLLRERVRRHTLWVRLSLKDDLPRALSVTQAGQRLAALCSPELHRLLTVELGWSPQHYWNWVTDLAEADLLRSK